MFDKCNWHTTIYLSLYVYYCLLNALPASLIPNEPSVTTTNDVYIVSETLRSMSQNAVTRSAIPNVTINKKEANSAIIGKYKGSVIRLFKIGKISVLKFFSQENISFKVRHLSK